MGTTRAGAMTGGLAAATLACLVLAGCTAAPTAEAKRTRSPHPSPSTAACIVGSWRAGATELQPLYNAIPTALDYPPATLGDGAVVDVDFTRDGTFTYDQDVSAALSWEGHDAAVQLGGTMTGTYRASGDSLTLASSDNALTVKPTDDQTASRLFAAATQVTLVDWPVSATTFRCDGDALELDLVTEGHPATVAFTRR
ncbi:MAG: hypothetical protein J0J00_06120 [Microbacterium sp.]|nr:hypothetical protein [Microbacterium sp.]